MSFIIQNSLKSNLGIENEVKFDPINWLILVGNVFWLPIRQNKFFGTIEFSVSIYGKILVILSPNLDILYRSLDFKYIQICRPFAPWKISPINLWKPHVKIIVLSVILPFPFCIIEHTMLLNWPSNTCLGKHWYLHWFERIK